MVAVGSSSLLFPEPEVFEGPEGLDEEPEPRVLMLIYPMLSISPGVWFLLIAGALNSLTLASN